MTTSQSLLIAFEVIISLLIIWGFIHEDKLIDFERKLGRYITLLIRKHRRRRQLAKKGNPAPKLVRREAYNPMIVHEPDNNCGHVA